MMITDAANQTVIDIDMNDSVQFNSTETKIRPHKRTKTQVSEPLIRSIKSPIPNLKKKMTRID
jgi:hypothetical protein